MFNLRFDLRTPPFTEVTHADQYRAMLEMVKWADSRGFAGAITSEHHGPAAVGRGHRHHRLDGTGAIHRHRRVGLSGV